MRYSMLVAAAAAFSTVSAGLTIRQDTCHHQYKECEKAGVKSADACSCERAKCLGEDNARSREYCRKALGTTTAAVPLTTGTPGNGSCTGNCTVPTTTICTTSTAGPTGTGTASTSVPIYTGAASQVGVSAAVMAAAGLFAYAL